MKSNDIQLTQVDVLGNLLAQIAELTKQADAIKDGIKEAGADGKLAVDADGVRYVEGNLFRATYSDTNRSTFDSKKFIAKFGADVYAEYTKTSAVFTVKVTSR
jgi:hypothetical protein